MEFPPDRPRSGRHGVPGLRCLILLLTVLLSGASHALDKAQGSMAPPVSPVTLDREDYAPFLLRPWRAGRGSVYLVMDPNCRYCLKVLDRLDRLHYFNTFVLWAPILGPASVDRVADFFRCDSPVGDTVLMAMQQRTSPQCTGAHEELRALNDAAVALLKINAVPGYFMDGRRVAAATLYRLAMQESGDRELPRNDGGFGAVRPRLAAVVDWQRYRDFRIGETREGKQVAALVLDPAAVDADRIIERIAADRRFDWYVFWLIGGDRGSLHNRIGCGSPVTGDAGSDGISGACDGNPLALLERNEEFQLLMGVDSTPAAFLDGRPVALQSLVR